MPSSLAFKLKVWNHPTIPKNEKLFNEIRKKIKKKSQRRPLAFLFPFGYTQAMDLRKLLRSTIAAFALPVLFLAACYSGPVEIPDGLTPAELVQLAQDATDRNRYIWASQYYESILDRFPENIDAVCGAEYEIAFIHYKQKRYDEAETLMRALRARYDAANSEFLPQKFKILSEIVLEKIIAVRAAKEKRDAPKEE